MRAVIKRRIKLLYRNVQRFRGGLVFQAHGLWYDSTLGLRAIKTKKKNPLSSDLGTEKKSRSTILTLGPGERFKPLSKPMQRGVR